MMANLTLYLAPALHACLGRRRVLFVLSAQKEVFTQLAYNHTGASSAQTSNNYHQQRSSASHEPIVSFFPKSVCVLVCVHVNRDLSGTY